jgi:hypothetical protein
MLKLISAVLPGVLAASNGNIHYGMWTQIDTTVVCEQDWSAISVAEAFAARGPRGARVALDQAAGCHVASNLLVGIGDLVWTGQGVTVVHNLDPKLPYVIVLAEYRDSTYGAN